MSEPGSATGADDQSAAGAAQVAGPQASVATKPDAAQKDPDTTGLVDIATKPFWVRHYTFTGTTVGLIFIWFSMTPSLLPRGAIFQALVSGFSGAIGYGLGVFSARNAGTPGARNAGTPGPAGAGRSRNSELINNRTARLLFNAAELLRRGSCRRHWRACPQ